MKDNHNADVSHTDEFVRRYQEMVKQAEDKYKAKFEYPKTEEEARLVDNLSSRQVNEFNLPDGYQFKDENGNVIEAKKIVLEKKKKEYPKTYEECCKIIDYVLKGETIIGHKTSLLRSLQRLLICRDAYWKIVGDWKPDYDSGVDKFGIIYYDGVVYKTGAVSHWERHANKILEFPTIEMRDAFYENFKELINQCKELL